MRSLLVFLGFQGGWWACALGAGRGAPWLGPLVMGAFLLGALVTRSPRVSAGRFALLILAAAAVGAASDALLVRAGALRFLSAGWPVPLWMIALWAGFAATLEPSLGWLLRRPLLALPVGALCGPLSYHAGARLGALTVVAPLTRSLSLIAVEWALALPVLVGLARAAQEAASSNSQEP